jgi:hypothetical protein
VTDIKKQTEECGGVHFIQLALDRDQWPALVDTVVYLRGSIEGREFIGQLSNYQLLKNRMGILIVIAETPDYCRIQSDEVNAFKPKRKNHSPSLSSAFPFPFCSEGSTDAWKHKTSFTRATAQCFGVQMYSEACNCLPEAVSLTCRIKKWETGS